MDLIYKAASLTETRGYVDKIMKTASVTLPEVDQLGTFLSKVSSYQEALLASQEAD